MDPWVGKISWRRKWQPTPVLLPGKFHGLRSLVGYSSWGHKESDTTERLHFLSLIRHLFQYLGFPGGASGKKPACQRRRHKRCRFNPWVRKIPWRSTWQLAPAFLPGELHGQRSLAGYSPELRRVRHNCSHAEEVHEEVLLVKF